MKKYNRGLIRSILPFILGMAIIGLVATLFNQNLDIRKRAWSGRGTPKPTKTPKPSSYPPASSCSSVSVKGGTYGGIVNGKSLYYLSSKSRVTLTANTTPANGSVNWKIASFSSALPNGGRFSSNNAPTVKYTAPINKSGADQGVEIRGDISEYPNPWIYCPPITFAIHTK